MARIIWMSDLHFAEDGAVMGHDPVTRVSRAVDHVVDHYADADCVVLSGDLVIVSPITACTPLFTLLLGRWVFGEAHLDTRAMIAVALVVPSLILIGLRSA